MNEMSVRQLIVMYIVAALFAASVLSISLLDQHSPNVTIEKPVPMKLAGTECGFCG